MARPAPCLPFFPAVGRRLESVNERVAHALDRRIADFLDDGAVEFGVLPRVANEPFGPKSRVRSRADRSLFWTVGLIGIIRRALAVCWSSVVIRERRATLRGRSEPTPPVWREVALRWLCAITRSPTTHVPAGVFCAGANRRRRPPRAAGRGGRYTGSTATPSDRSRWSL